MKKLLYILFLIFNLQSGIFNLYSQQPTQEWANRFSWNSYASGISVKQDSVKNIYVLMKLYSDSTLNDFGIIKYGPSGNLMWSSYYNSPGNGNDQPVAFDVNAQGDIYITGTSSTEFTDRISTVKYNSNGILQWSKVYDGGGPGDSPGDIKLDRSGNAIVIGGSSINNNLAQAFIIKYDLNGDTIWVKKFNQLPQSSFNNHLIIDSLNNIYTIGYYETSLADYLILKYDTNGNLVWYTLYDSPQSDNDIGYHLTFDPNHNIYIVGSTFIFGAGLNNSLLKLNSSGVIQWSKIFRGVISGNGQCASEPKGLAVSSDGNFICYTTACYSNTALTDIVTIKYTSSGDSIWVRNYNGGVANTSNRPAALTLDRDNNIYITGVANRQTSGDDIVTIKYLPDGNQQWIATYNGPLTNSFDNGNDLIIDSEYNIYITGTSSRNNGNPILWDAVTIKYNQPNGIISNGNELPGTFKLYQNYPNPFNSTTIITYQLPKKSFVTLTVYNITGQLVKTLVNTEQNSGYYSIAGNMEMLASGVYFYILLTNNTLIDTKKFILIK